MVNNIFGKIFGLGGNDQSSQLNNQQFNIKDIQNSQTYFNNQIFQHSVNMKEQERLSRIRCEELKKELANMDNVVQNIVNDIGSEMSSDTYVPPIYVFFEENILKRNIKIAKIIEEHIKKHDFAKKLEGLIDDDGK